jgi:hypothetical protein
MNLSTPLGVALGGLAGALLVLGASAPLGIVVAAVLLVLVAVTSAVRSRTDLPWAHPGEGQLRAWTAARLLAVAEHGMAAIYRRMFLKGVPWAPTRGTK